MSLSTAPFVEFRNLDGYIRATDTRTGVSSWFNKGNVVFQAIDEPAGSGADDSFLVKSDSYVKYFRWGDVAVPARDGVAPLLAQLAQWAVQDLPLYLHTPSTVLQLKPLYDTLPVTVGQVANDATPFPAGGGGALAAAGASSQPLGAEFDSDARAVSLVAPADPAGPGAGGGVRVARQSKQYAPAPADKRMVALVGATLVKEPGLPAGVAFSSAVPADLLALEGTVCRAGVFDDRLDVPAGQGQALSGNGVFVEFSHDPSRGDWATDAQAQRDLSALDAAASSNYVARWREAALWAVLRTSLSGSQADLRVPQHLWGLDRLRQDDGSVFDLDPLAPATYAFQYSGTAGIDARVGVLHGSGVSWVHSWDSTDPLHRLAASSLPVRWEIDNRHGASNASMQAGAAIVSCDGQHDVQGRPVSFDTHLATTTLSTQEQTPVISFRLDPQRNRGSLRPMRLSLLNTGSAGSCKYELRVNAALSGATWAAADAYSFDAPPATPSLSLRGDAGSSMQVDTAATAVSGGVAVVSGYLYDADVRELGVDFSLARLHASADGTPDTLTLVATLLVGSVDVAASLQFLEHD